MPHRKAKKPRGSRGSKHAPCVGDNYDGETNSSSAKNSYYDLMLPIPNDKDKAVKQLKLQQCLDRLEFLGYSSVALVHRVYGKPKDTIVVDQLFEPYEEQTGTKKKKRRKRNIQIYRRLHAVLENISDIAFFNDPKMLQSYDLVSVAPCTESIFHASCSSLVDLITLDYSRGGGLPYRIRSSHIQAAVEHNIALEVPYTPSIFHLPHRKALIQTVRALQSASIGKKVQLLVSSGGDTNIMALRSPGDMANVLETVAGLDPTLARRSQSIAGEWVLDAARKRRVGGSSNVRTSVIHVRIGDMKEEGDVKETKATGKESEVSTDSTAKKSEVLSTDVGAVDVEEEVEEKKEEDGFITF